MKYNFTDQVRSVVDVAWEEVVRLGHDKIQPQHIFLALTRETEGIAIELLNDLPLELEQVRARLECLSYEDEASVPGGRFPFTRPTAKLLELAMVESRQREHSYVGTEHVLLGILREEHDNTAALLAELGVTYDRILPPVLQRIGS